MTKFTNIIVSLIFVSLMVGGLSIFYGNLTDNYNIDYNESELESYNNIQELYNQTKELESEATQIDPDSNALQQVISVIDGFFNGAYKTLVLAYQSFNVFDSVTNEGVNDLGIGEYTGLIKSSIGIIAIILIIIGIIVAAIVKKDL